MTDILIATCAQYPELYPDDALLAQALRQHGLSVQPWLWMEPRPSAARACLIRSTWDYVEHYPRFRQWVDATARDMVLMNAAPLVRWNVHKGYLVELAGRGLPVIATELVSGERQLTRYDHDVVIKPAVSAGARNTKRFSPAQHEQAQLHLNEVLQHGDALVQPYLRSVEGEGERSLIFIDGRFTHAVRRPPALVEGNREDQLLERVRPGVDELDVAQRVLSALPSRPVFARVDLARLNNGQPALMELELIEPRLFLRESEDAVPQLANAVLAQLR